MLAVASAAHASDDHRHRDAHVHGHTELNIALDGRWIYLELHSPAANIVGFEHAPRSEAEHKAQAQALAELREGETLFAFEGAHCKLEGVEVEHETEHEGHADVEAFYRFRCDAAPELIQVKLFQRFPGTEEIKMQLITPSGQRGLELIRGATAIPL